MSTENTPAQLAVTSPMADLIPADHVVTLSLRGSDVWAIVRALDEHDGVGADVTAEIADRLANAMLESGRVRALDGLAGR